jgi:hypothetical protein
MHFGLQNQSSVHGEEESIYSQRCILVIFIFFWDSILGILLLMVVFSKLVESVPVFLNCAIRHACVLDVRV